MAETKIKAGQFSGIVGHGTDGYFLMTNGDGTMAWAEGGATGPSVTSVSYPGDDTAADPAGGQTVVLTGTNFGSSMTVSIGGTTAPSVAHDSSTQLTITTPAKAAGDYDIVVTNTVTGASGTFVNGISYNGVPTWTTAAGSLGTFESETTISTITLQATEPDGGTITFNITNGALPTGLSLTGANIDGTTTAESSTTLYSFTIEAIDDENQATPRNFSITVNSAELVPSQNFTINTYTGNGSTQSIEGKIGTAASFNGSSSKIDFSSYKVPTTNVSFSLWFRSNNTPSATATAEVLYNHFNGAQSYGVQIGSSTIGSYALASGGTPDYLTYSMSADTLWHHVVVTMGSTNGHVLYIDGSAVATDSALTSYNGGGTGANHIGTADTSKWFDGQIDQFRIFEKELSSSEVTTLYNEPSNLSTASTTDIFDDGSGVALYEFEEGAKDTGGTNGYIGAAGVFNGSSSKIVVSGFTQPTSDLSVSMWVKFNSISSAQKEFFDWVGNSSVPTIRLNTYNSNDLRFSMGGSRYISADSLSITTGIWYHIAFSIDRSANAATLYFNGSALGSTITPSGSSSDTEGLFIGCNLDENRFSDCIIDQVRIFSKAISSSEVTTLYGETSASATKSNTDIFDDSSGIALYELEGNANDTGDTYNGTATNVSWGYDGTPTNVSFVGTSFQPDLIWVKRRSSAQENGLYDSVRGATKQLYSDLANAEVTATGSVTSFDSNGFSIGNGGIVNGSGQTHVAWCWKAGDTTVTDSSTGTVTTNYRANTEAGFSIVKFDGASGANYVPHGLSQAPELFIMKSANVSGNWGVYVKDLGADKYLLLNSTASAATSTGVWNNTHPTSTLLHWQGGLIAAGGSGQYNNIAYCFHSVDGYQKIGSYTGTSAAGHFIETGFQPRFLLTKRASAAGGGWNIFDSARGTNKRLFPHDAAAEATDGTEIVTFNSNGFTFNTADSWNNNSLYSYIYLAIA